MRTNFSVMCAIGTRPEAIKMAPVIKALKNTSWSNCITVVTGQHRSLLDQMLERLEVPVDHDLNIMSTGQQLSDIVSLLLPALDQLIRQHSPDLLLAQGDTASVFAASIAAFHRAIPFGHVEAGLRTNDLGHPFPEEGYRQMISRIASWHFSPTDSAANALLGEGIRPAAIRVTGNTGIDTLMQTVQRLPAVIGSMERLILVTTHRRENFGQPLREIALAVKDIVENVGNTKVVWPLHPNPNVRGCVIGVLGNHPRVELCEPQDYFAFIDLMRRSTLILTDSGGIQEEAPALGKPVLVLRETTERPEAVTAGAARLVGANREAITAAACTLLTDPCEYEKMVIGESPFGDGKASARIVDFIQRLRG